MYIHFTLQERYKLTALLNEGFDQDDIAERLGRSASSIGRELFRNSKADGTYEAQSAHKLSGLRRKNSKQSSRKIENDPELSKNLEQRLDRLTSPETVVQDKDIPTCCATVYAWIYRLRPDLKQKLPYQGKKRRKYGTKRAQKQGWTSKVPDIDTRPKSVERRGELYHYEGDTILGSSGRLLTYTERKSRFEIALQIPRGSCDIVHEKTRECFSDKPVNSFTYDRGSEFALWQMIERDTGAKTYFAKPHHPWQRGTNENTNGRLRRVYPKKFDFSTITQKDVDAVIWKMNHTKRKCLNWRTPCEVFKACCTSS